MAAKGIRTLVGRLIFKTDADGKLKRVDKSLKNVSKSARKTSNRMRKFKKSIRRATRSMQGMVSAYLGFRTLQYAISGVTNEVSDLTTEAERLGMTVSQMQKWQYVMEGILGDSAKKLTPLVIQMQGQIADAVTNGTKKTKAAISDMGLSLKNLSGMSTNKKMMAIVEALAKMTDKTKQMNAAMQLGGRRNATTLIMMANHLDQVRGAEKKVKNLTLSKKEINAQAEMTKKLATMKLVFMKLKVQMLIMVKDALGPLIDRFSAWLQNPKNVETLKKYAKWFFGIAGAISAVLVAIQALGMASTVILATVGALGKVVSVLKLIPTILGGILKIIPLLVSGILRAISALVAFGQAMVAAVAANPVGAIVVAIIAAIALIYIFRKEIWAGLKWIWKKLKGWAKSVWQFMKKYGLYIGLALLGPIGWALDLIIAFWPQISAFFGRIWQGAKNVALKVKGWFVHLKDSIVNLFRGIADFFIGMWKGVINAFQKAIGWYVSKIAWVAHKMSAVLPDSLISKIDKLNAGFNGRSVTGTSSKSMMNSVNTQVGKVVVNVQGSTNMSPSEMSGAVGRGVRKGVTPSNRLEVANAGA